MVDDCAKDHDPYVTADRQRFMQVLLNVLGNAIKYNRPGGRVTLTCERTTTERVRLKVTDTGCGIAPEKMGLLFSPFERLGAEKTGVEGTGLGLALSKRLVEAMGGVIGVESTPGEGSTFWVELAAAESPRARVQRQRDSGEPQPPPLGQSCTLLYIEDNLANLALIETVLSDRPGIKLHSALQGQVGIDLAKKHAPDVILLDLHLPDMTGDEVRARLKCDPLTRDIPVIIISADASPGHREKLLLAHAADYLAKPLDVNRLMEMLDEIVKAKRR